MTDRYNKAFKISIIMHAALLVVVLLVPLLGRWFKREKPREIITFVELVQPAPPAPAPAPAPPAPEPVKPPPPKVETPKPEPKPEPPKPEPTPTPVRQPTPRQEIKVNTNRIVRRDAPPPQPQRPQLTEQQLRDQLLASLPTTQTTTAPATSPNELAAYYARIQGLLYNAWEQPPGVAGLNTVVTIRIARNGAIMQRSFTRRSGNESMDASVMRALQSVATLPSLPGSVRDAYIDVSIKFESTGLSM
ncbi:MAG TPA: energy transducer TonB [Kiritimatiellia bacterium]|nr:energy transducer TonB [Kiritimatiellia bacterium]